MRRTAPALLALLLLSAPAAAQDASEAHASYDIYVAGLHVAQVEADFGVGLRHYQLQVAYHTTGLVGWFHHAHQISTVVGTWDGGQPQPRQFEAVGVWGGDDRLTLIDYPHGQPLVRRLVPAQDVDREPVPAALQQNSLDSLSVLALLIRRVGDTSRCEGSVHIFDGHRAFEISARTVGEETLPPTDRSAFSGKALRCDFVDQTLAGFLHRDTTPYDRRPLHGSIWLARGAPGEPPLPVRMQFETRLFSDATVYLTRLGWTPATEIAAH